MLARAKSNQSLTNEEFKSRFREDFLVNTAQAAMYLDISEDTLNHWRSDGKGPKFVKLTASSRGSVKYQIGDLREFVASRVVRSAADGMLREGMARVSADINDWGYLHPFIVRPHFIMDSAWADERTAEDVFNDPFIKLRWLKPEATLSKPWLRAKKRVLLLRLYLNTLEGAKKAQMIEHTYRQALRRIPENLYGSHPDLTLKALIMDVAREGGNALEYPIEVGPPLMPWCPSDIYGL